MNGGYVLNFSDRTFQDFVLENANIDVYTPGYERGGTSKANRLRTFWRKESDTVTAKLLEGLLEYWRTQKRIFYEAPQVNEENLYKECFKIILRLKGQAGLPENHTSMTQGPHTGVFIAARKMVNDGKISGSRVDLITESYSGKGEVLSPTQTPPISISHSNVHFGQGNNIGFNRNIQESLKDIPLWLKWVVAIVAVLVFLWEVYIYFSPIFVNNSGFSLQAPVDDSDMATSTTQLSAILNKALTFDTVIERQDFLTKYIGDQVSGQGTIKDISRFGGTLLIDIDFSPKDVNCNQEASEENEKKWLLAKGRRIEFIGKFPFFGTPEHGLNIDECILTFL